MKNYKYIALAALALSFTACSQDDDFTPQQEDIVQIASANIATEVQTRVNTLDDGTQWENNDQILLVNNSRDSKNNGTYTYNGTAWELTNGIVLYASGTNNFKAYYPAESEEDYEFPTDQSTEAGIKSADRMVATTSGVAKGDAVALSFERQNAKITITPTLTTEFIGKSISSLLIAGVTPYHPEEATDYTAIITPSETGFIVSVNVDGQSLTAESSTAIEAGKHYTFSLTVGKTAVAISEVSVNAWTEKPISDVEVVRESVVYDPMTKTYTVHLPDGVQAAIDAAELTGTADSPATIKLLVDAEVSGIQDEMGNVSPDILVEAGMIILDLNGHTLTGTAGYSTVSVTEGATLIIEDNSETQSGKIKCGNNNVLYVDGGTLVVNSGSFEGRYCVYGYNAVSITINGGIFTATEYAIYPQNTTLTITGGTFVADKAALYFNSATTPSIKGGSFIGREFDIDTSGKTGFLSYNADGEGPTFPGGLTIWVYTGCPTLADLLVGGAAYYDADGNQLTLENGATSYEGDVTVKKVN